MPLERVKLRTGKISQGGPKKVTGHPAKGESSRGESIDQHRFQNFDRCQVDTPRAG
jgi:hypothetical protein